MSEDLMREALRGALVVRRPLAGLIIHSDQGSQYRATRFKAKLLDGGSFPGLAEAKLEISHYITYCNDDTPPSATTRPITSKPNFKPRPNCVRLS